MLDSLASSITTNKVMFSGIFGTVFAVLVGEPSLLLLSLFILFFIDTITGVWSAFANKKFESRHMRKGVTKFILYCLSIIIAHQFAAIPLLFWLEDAILSFLSMVELASIGENMNKLGFNFPSFEQLKNILKRTNKETNG